MSDTEPVEAAPGHQDGIVRKEWLFGPFPAQSVPCACYACGKLKYPESLESPHFKTKTRI